MHESDQIDNWQNVLKILADIIERDDYTTAHVDFILTHLQSADDRIRGAATLASKGCIFEPGIIDILLDITENDFVPAIRKASIQSLGNLIHEGVFQNFENNIGANADLEFYEEWDEIQTQTLQDDYRRVKHLLFSIIQDDLEEREVREASLLAVSDLGFLQPVREWIEEFINSKFQSSQLVALKAMGKYPYYWITQLGRFITPETPKSLLLEAISSSYSSESGDLAEKIESLLQMKDPDIISYSLLTLANINKTDGLGLILQQYCFYKDEKIREAAKEAIINFSNKNQQDFLERELGLGES